MDTLRLVISIFALSAFLQIRFGRMSDSTAPKDGNRNRAVELMTVAWCECAVSMVFVALRMYSRIKITHNLWWDDYFILLTSVSLLKRNKISSNFSCIH